MNTEVVSLGEVVTITAGQSPPSSTYNENGLGLPFFQGKADFGEIHPIARKWCVAPRKTAEAGDILISIRAPVGPTNIAGERCCIGRGLAAIRPDENLALRDFVHWIIRHREHELIAKGQGSTFAAIGQEYLKSFLIPLPPLNEQRRIIGILNRAAKIGRMRAQAEKRLREFVPALFVKMFGDPVENSMGWEIKTLGDLCDMDRRGIKPNDPVASQLRFVGGENVDSGIGTFNFDSDSRIGAQKGAAFPFDARHVLYGKLRPYLNKVATPDFHGRCSTELIPLLPRDGVNRDFLAHLLRREETVDYVMASVTGSRMPRADMKALLSMPVPVPPFDAQRQYAKIVKSVHTTVKLAHSGHKTTASLTASLMSRLLGAGA